MENRLSRDDWLRAGRIALLRGGVQAVSVERLARELGVTKGSFYWHFADRADLLEALLSEWEAEADLLIGAIGVPDGCGIRQLAEILAENVILSERGEAPSDAAIFAWAAAAPDISERVRACEEERIALLAALLGDRSKAELFYMAYLGFILRRRHADNAKELFALVLNLAETTAAEDQHTPQDERR